MQKLESEGWFQARQKGSHKIYKHADKPALRVVIPDHGTNKELSRVVLNNIKKTAGWK